jgi:hypothetical protein
MRRRDIAGALVASAAATALGSEAVRRQPSGSAPVFPPTEAEASAKVTPLHTEFPPGNVRRYGAGDGRTPDEVAFQNACAANNLVIVPHGTYVFNSQVTLEKSNLTILGENPGPGSVIIRLARAAGHGAAVFRWTTWAADVHLVNLGILLKNPRAAQIGVRFPEVRRSRVMNCYIEGPAEKGNDTTAIQFDGTGTYSGDVDVENCYLTANRIGVDLQRTCTTVRILNCEIYGTQRIPGTMAVKLSSSCAGVLISGNTFEGWDVGVYSEGCYTRQIGNYFEDNTTHWQWRRGAGRARIWNSSFGDICLVGGTPVYPRNDVDSCIVFGQTASFVDNGYIEAARGFRERQRPFNLGEWTAPPFAAEHFSGSDGTTWTVKPQNIETYAYTVVGKTMTLTWSIAASVIAARANPVLRLAIPDGYVPGHHVRVPTSFASNGVQGFGIAEASANRPQIDIYLAADKFTNFNAGPVDLHGQITFAVR